VWKLCGSCAEECHRTLEVGKKVKWVKIMMVDVIALAIFFASYVL
jgi:hypothetical protein